MSLKIRETASLESLHDRCDEAVGGVLAHDEHDAIEQPFELMLSEIDVERQQRNLIRSRLRRAQARVRVKRHKLFRAIVHLSSRLLDLAGRKHKATPYKEIFGTFKASAMRNWGADRMLVFVDGLNAKLPHLTGYDLEGRDVAVMTAADQLREADRQRDELQVEAATYEVRRRSLVTRVQRLFDETEATLLQRYPGDRELVRAMLDPVIERRSSKKAKPKAGGDEKAA